MTNDNAQEQFNQAQATKEYTFTMTFQEATMAVSGIKKLPMEFVEGLVAKLDNQFKIQREAELEAAPTPPTYAPEEVQQAVAAANSN